jgi:NADPH:quinone reductase-like Zn-dependent oxidoreductase
VQFFHQARTKYAENAEIARNLASGRWRIPVERIFELEDVPRAQAMFENRELFGRTLIRVGGDL